MHQYCCHHCQELEWNQLRLALSESLQRCGKKKKERHASSLLCTGRACGTIDTKEAKSCEQFSRCWTTIMASFVSSEHAWWMLSQEELQTIIADILKRAELTATSRMTGLTPKQQVAIKKHKPATQPKGTTSNSGSSGSTTPAKSASASSPSNQGIQVKQELGLSREPKGPPAPGLQSSSESSGAIRPPRTAGRPEIGWSNPLSRRRAIGQGTPFVAPEQCEYPHSNV